MTPFSSFYPYIMPYVPGASEIMVDSFLRDVCIDFCSKSLIDTQTLDVLDGVAAQADYDFSTPDQTAVTRVMQAWYESVKLGIVHADQTGIRADTFNNAFTGADTVGGNPRNLIQKDDISFTLITAPQIASSSAITIRAALKPTRTATSVADILFNDYAYEIGQEVCARLMMIPKQAFTDPKMAGVYSAKYTVARNAAQLRAATSLGRGETMVDLRGAR